MHNFPSFGTLGLCKFSNLIFGEYLACATLVLSTRSSSFLFRRCCLEHVRTVWLTNNFRHHQGQWGDCRKIHWVNWKTLYQPKSEGGMGFKDLCLFNDALLAKQVWRLLHYKHSLCYHIFKARFFPNYSIMEATDFNSGSYAWRSILKGRDVLIRGAR